MAKVKAKKKATKEYAQEMHSRKRFFERYGFELTHDKYMLLCSYLKKGKTEYDDGTIVVFVAKQSNRTTVKLIRARHFCEEDIIAVYDKQRGTICTFLPAGTTADLIQWNIFDTEEEDGNSDNEMS
jgi:hypothetical protein